MSPFLLLLFVASLHASQADQLYRLTSVKNIIQDKQGFIWFSGHQGLTRYDGNELINFTNTSSNWQLPFAWTNDVQRVNSQLLVSTESNRLWLFDPKTGLSSPLNITTKSDTIYFASFFNGQYYIYTKAPNILYRYDPQTSSTEILNKNITLNGFLTTKNSLYYHNNMGIYKIKQHEIKLLLKAQVKAAIANKEWLVIATDKALITFQNEHQEAVKNIDNKISALTFENNSDNFFTINNKNHINKYNQLIEKLDHGYSTDLKAQSRSIYHDSSGTLWLAGSHGVKKTSAIKIKNHPRIYDTFINGIQVEVIHEQLVLGSYGAGLQCLSKNKPIVAPQINNNLSKEALLITDLHTINEEMYLTTFDGLWHYKLKDKSLRKVNFENNDKILLKVVNKDHLLYLATDENGFIIYDLKNTEISAIINEDFPLSSPEVIDILPFENSIWLATAKGIDIYNKQSKQIETIANTSSKVMSLTIANNKIYAATKGEGILVFNQNKELLTRFAVGIDFDQIRNINNEIWAPSSNGLYRISIDDNQITMVSGSEDYSFTSEAVLHKNAIYVGHYGGVLEVPLTPEEKLNAKIYISKTTISGKPYLLNKSINIDNSNEIITLDLASLDYRTGQEKQFKYQINGGTWNKINGSQLTLTGLASGSYYLTILGTNSLGQWSDFQAFTEIHVDFPWYWSPQIRVIYAVLIIGFFLLTLWLLYLRGKSIKYIHKVLSTEAKSKSKTTLLISRNLSHALALSVDNKNKETTTGFEQNKTKIESILQESINELTYPNQHNEPDGLYGKSLQVALPYFIQYLSKKYHIKVNLDYSLNETQLNDDLVADIYKIIYEALTSAILNGDGQNYRLNLKQHNEKVWVTINDDANSFSNFKNQINFDMAMYFIRQIANKYNATVNTFDQQNQGSQLVIIIPLRILR